MSLFRRLESYGEQSASTAQQPLYLPGLQHSLRLVDEDILEVRRIDNGIIRAIMWFVFWLSAFFVALSWWEYSLPWRNIEILLYPEEYFRAQYDRWVERNGGTHIVGDFPGWYADMMSMHGHRWVEGLIFLLIPIFFFYCAFIWPRYRPVRFNRKMKVAYTWSWGRFFITSLDKGTWDLDMTLRGTSVDPSENMSNPDLINYGPLMIRLRHRRWTRYQERWPLGVFPPTHAGQNSQIASAIDDFITSDTRPDWCDELARQARSPLLDRFLIWAFNLSLLPTWWPRRTGRILKKYAEDQIAKAEAEAAAAIALRRRANGLDD